MKVLHFEHMGVGVVLSQALRKFGVDSRVLSSTPHPFGFKEDYLFHTHRFIRGWMRHFVRRIEWRRFFDFFDVLHNHDPNRLPSYVLHHWKGRMFQHYHGSNDKPLYKDMPSFVSLPTTLKNIPEATWLPLPVDTSLFKPANPTRYSSSIFKNKHHGKICVGYCNQTIDPRKPQFIPKAEVEQAVKKLGSKYYTFPLTDIIPHWRISEYYGELDVWVDRVNCGFYGFASVEAAAMGIPVITEISEEAKTWVPNCPFLSVNREGVADAVVMLAEDSTLRNSLGKKCRRYAVNQHDSLRVAETCLKKYKELIEC